MSCSAAGRQISFEMTVAPARQIPFTKIEKRLAEPSRSGQARVSHAASQQFRPKRPRKQEQVQKKESARARGLRLSLYLLAAQNRPRCSALIGPR